MGPPTRRLTLAVYGGATGALYLARRQQGYEGRAYPGGQREGGHGLIRRAVVVVVGE
jgi:hypothetical protein